MLIVSLLLQADIAVLDEIDSGLDIDALRDVADAVNSLKRDTSATLMVTHYKVLHNHSVLAVSTHSFLCPLHTH